MNPIDDMFRKGLDGRPGEVPADMWSRVRAGQTTPVPEGAELDKLFADGLKDHAGQVPADMWSRIAATGLPAAAAVDQVFSDGLKDRVGDVPAGMWDRIWRARTAAPRFNAARWASAAAVILLLLLAGWWLLPGTVNDALADGGVETPKEAVGVAVAAIEKETATGPESDAGQTRVTAGAAATGSEGFVENIRIPVGAAAAGSESGVGNTRATAGPATAGPESVVENTLVPAGAAANGSESIVENTRLTAGAAANGSEGVVGQTRLTGQFTATASLHPLDIPTAQSLAVKATEIKVKGRYRPKPSNDRAFRAAPRHRFQTELLFGAAYADQQLTPFTEADRPLSNLREVSEFPELSYQVSLRGAYNLNERLIFLGGLTYAEIRNQFEYERTVAGETSLIVTNNSIRMLEAPLLLGYRMPGRRLQVSLNAGPVVNLSTRARGRFLDPRAVQPLDLATEGNYRRNVGVGFMTSLSTTYQIGKKEPFVLLVEPFFKAYPTAFTAEGAPVKETYWVAGLQLGVRKGF